jgi:serine protease Do
VKRLVFPALVAWLSAAVLVGAQTREEKVRNDRKKVEADGFWIYNDLAKGFAQAKQSGKPMLVVLRCIPCEECVKLDDDLVNKDPRIRPLLDRFVCGRVVSANGLDLSLFQFDTDQSFAAFLLNADGTVYGRFGTRSHRTAWADDVSVEGLARALEGALALHEQYPKNKAELAGKKGPPPEFATPEKYPFLKGRYGPQLDHGPNVVRSCIHCHQIGDAQRRWHRDRGAAISEKVLFPYPHPKAIGLILDPRERATVLRSEKDSPAERAGFQKGDAILKLEGQPLLSLADVQWVLHQGDPAGASLKAKVRRGEREVELTLTLPKGWRQRDDLSWRASSWELRRMVTGGLLLKSTPAEQRTKLGLADGDMALTVEHVGQYSPHDAAKRAGFQKGDVLVSFDGKTALHRESDLIAHALAQHKPGARIDVTILRGGKKMSLVLPIQP